MLKVGKQLSQEERLERDRNIVSMIQDSYTNGQIAEITGMSKASVSRITKTARERAAPRPRKLKIGDDYAALLRRRLPLTGHAFGSKLQA